MASGRRLFIVSSNSISSISKSLLHGRRTLHNGRFNLSHVVPLVTDERNNNNNNISNNHLDSYRRFFASTSTVHHPEQAQDQAAVQQASSTMRDRARARMAQARLAGKASAQRGQDMAKRGAATSFAKLKQYGPVFVGTYISLYLGTLGTIYAGVDTGLVDPATIFSYISTGAEAESKNTADIIIDYLNHYAWTKPAVPFFEKNPHFANLGVAWVATKFTEPIRLGVAMAIVPRLATYFGYHPPVEEGEEETMDGEQNTAAADTATAAAGDEKLAATDGTTEKVNDKTETVTEGHVKESSAKKEV